MLGFRDDSGKPRRDATAPGVADGDAEVVRRRHPEWAEHQVRWRWLLDSLEGGERYRQAVYGYDNRSIPVRNLIRHKREYPDPRESATDNIYAIPDAVSLAPGAVGSDPASVATIDDYEMRRARTPAPSFLPDVIETHLSRIYARDVEREGPLPLQAWWEDVDGRGTSIDDWMADDVGPLLLALGQLDIYCDRPVKPDDEALVSQADVLRLRLDRCVASYVLPENMVWWRLNPDGSYAECLVREFPEGDDAPMPGAPNPPVPGSVAVFRHWEGATWTLYGPTGQQIKAGPNKGKDAYKVLDEGTHEYGQVPIRRHFVRRKSRCNNVGMSMYCVIAELQREFYNRDSELILSDTTQAHPLLQGPEDYCTADGTLPMGPGFLAPKKKVTSGADVFYEGFDYVDAPKDGAESIRRNKADIIDAIDRAACLTKPAGAAGTDGRTVGQSGVSKRLDKDDGNDKLAKLAKVLARFERCVAGQVLAVLNPGKGPGEFDVKYPSEFDLFSLDEILDATEQLQGIASASGLMPETEKALMSAIVRRAMPGKDDDEYGVYEDEFATLMTQRNRERDEDREARLADADPAAGDVETGQINV